MLARITLIQTEAQLNLTEKSITDTWALTDKQGRTITAFDKDTLLATIINKGGCFGVVYQDPEYFYLMCSYFWKRWKSVFADWYETAAIEYNPLENYDRIEEWTDTTKDVSAETNSQDRSANNSGSTQTDGASNTATAEQSEDTNGGTSENKVSAYNATTYAPHDKQETTGNTQSTTAGTTAGETHDSTSTSGSENETMNGARAGTFDRDFTHGGRIHGNIGVTTSQQMAQAQYELQLKWGNLYGQMADIFIKEMLITIY